MHANRRKFLGFSLGAIAGLITLPKTAGALSRVTPADVGIFIPAGIWDVLGQATNGSDPSTAVIAPGNFTASIQALAGKEVEIQGYLQPVANGFGQHEYVLSRMPFHCAFCYAGGRASLVLVQSTQHLRPASDGLVTLRGTLALQTTDPADYYFQLQGAKKT